MTDRPSKKVRKSRPVGKTSNKRPSYLPDEKDVVAEIPFKSPKTGKSYTIYRTEEVDAYEEKPKPKGIRPQGKK